MALLHQYLEKYADRILATDDEGAVLRYGEVISVGRKFIDFARDKRLIILLLSNTVQSLAAYITAVADGHAVLLLDASVDKALLSDIERIYRPDTVVVPDQPDTSRVIVHGKPRPLHSDLSILLSTSGSTGSPKLARFGWKQAEANALAIAEYLSIGERERAFVHLPLHYSYGYSVVNSHIVVGARLELTNHTVMQREFWQRLSASQATSLPGVPFHYEMLHRLGLKRLNLGSLKTLTQAGGRLSPELVTAYSTFAEEKGLNFYVMYGQTEAGPRISYCPPALSKANPGSIGYAIPGVRLSLLDEAGIVNVSEEAEGELVCESPAIMLGYAQQEADLALGDILGGRLVTGDLARRAADGTYTLTGRKSRFLKLYGNRVNLDDIERFASKKGYHAACVGVDNWLCIALEGEAPVEPLREAVISAFRFPPRSIEIRKLDSLPRSESGKVMYKKLLEMVHEAPST